MSLKTKIIALVGAFLFAGQASAITIGSGHSFPVDRYVDSSTRYGLNDDLSATRTWMVSSHSATRIIMDTRMTNRTLLTRTLKNAGIAGSWLRGQPERHGNTAVGRQHLWHGSLRHRPEQTFPGRFKHIDACISSSGCPGSSVKSALHAGASDRHQIELAELFGSTIDLLFFPEKFQTDQGFHEVAGTTGCVGGNCTAVPEPPVLALLGLGLLGIGLVQRRKA